MATNPFHLAWFMNFVPDEWDAPLAARGRPLDGQFYVEMAQAMERACFDQRFQERPLGVIERVCFDQRSPEQPLGVRSAGA